MDWEMNDDDWKMIGDIIDGARRGDPWVIFALMRQLDRALGERESCDALVIRLTVDREGLQFSFDPEMPAFTILTEMCGMTIEDVDSFMHEITGVLRKYFSVGEEVRE